MTRFPLMLSLGLALLSWPAAAEPRPVLVELFTSEGCSSCPRADALLREMVRTQPFPGVTLVPLELHVDYWNGLGWQDPFSSAAFTARQSDYQQAFGKDGVYTPEMVVQGERGFVADASSLKDAVARAASEPALGSLSVTRIGPSELAYSASAPDGTDAVELWLAVTEEGLQTQVPRGENAGRTLVHAPVVRTLAQLRRLSGGRTETGRVPLTLTGAGRRAVAFLQERGSRRVLKVAVLDLGALPPEKPSR